MENKYSWPLNVPQFSFVDKLKLAKFVLFDDQWTQGKQVKAFEDAMAEFINCRYAVFVSSGSTANTILAMQLKDKTSYNQKIVVFPSTTWTTSVAPFIREGFTPHFIDINRYDYSINLNKLVDYLEHNHDKVACVFITSLIGFVPDIGRLKKIAYHYGVNIMMDNCENTLGNYYGYNVSSFFTSTTSTYFGHQIQSVEGGFIFTNDQREYEYCLMARNHGLVRALPESRQIKYRNEGVDSKFDFNILGNNYRNSDINAFIGLMDLKRAGEYREKRRKLYEVFLENVSPVYSSDSPIYYGHKDIEHVPFCIPIVMPQGKIHDAKRVCNDLGIETRPIISGNLLKQTCYAKWAGFDKYPNSDRLHENGFYVGLHAKLTEEEVINFTCELNKVF